jgi:general secretion pathway protein H
MSRIGKPYRSQRGFTLIEVMVVLTILALITALALPMLSGAEAAADTRAAAHEIAAGLRMTRNLAMMRGRDEAFSIDTESGAFRVGPGAPQRVPRGVHLVLITATEEQIDANSGGIRFFPDGSSTGGGVGLSKGDIRGAVLVDWLTGRISIGAGSHAIHP